MIRLLLKKTSVSDVVGRRRVGVSLLEIMISIGVVGIGLIGVASLIPLAHYKASQGVREERKALYGKRAFREFFVRGFNRPGTGVDGRYGMAAGVQRPNWIHVGIGSIGNIHDAQGRFLPQTYCFDPHEIAYKMESGISGAHHFFPNNTGYQISVPRVTVRQVNPEQHYHSALLQGQSPGAALSTFSGMLTSPTFLRSAQADEIFRIRDDVVIVKPTTPEQSPMMSYLYEGTPGSITPTKVTTAGTFSWMATLVPERRVDSLIGVHANRFVMSVVIFNQRDLSGAYREEVVAQIDPTLSVFTDASKEIFINELDADPALPKNVGVRDIRSGDWIALVQNPAGIIPPQSPPGAPNVPNAVNLKWYQVTTADELEGDFDVTRELQLNGPDWVPLPTMPVYTIYLRNVVSVYEKTVELNLD